MIISKISNKTEIGFKDFKNLNNPNSINKRVLFQIPKLKINRAKKSMIKKAFKFKIKGQKIKIRP